MQRFRHLPDCFLGFICSSVIGFRRSTRWSTAATAPLRGASTSAPHRSLWRGYGLIWTGKMRQTAGRSQIMYPPHFDFNLTPSDMIKSWLTSVYFNEALFILHSSKSGGDSTLIQKLAEMSEWMCNTCCSFTFASISSKCIAATISFWPVDSFFPSHRLRSESHAGAEDEGGRRIEEGVTVTYWTGLHCLSQRERHF